MNYSIIAITAVAFLGLESCSKSIQEDDSRAIRFEASKEKPAEDHTPADHYSRAGLVGINFADSDVLGVLGYELPAGTWRGDELPSFMYNSRLTKISANNYAYSPMKSWPADPSKVRFFAYYPHSGSVTSGAVTPSSVNHNGYPNVEVVLGKSNEPIDFLVAQRDPIGYSETTNGSVGFTFRHKLSKLIFKAKAAGFTPAASYKIFVNQLMIKNVFNKAVFLFDGTTDVGYWPEDQKVNENLDAVSGATLHLPSSSTPLSMTDFEDLLDPSGAGAYILMIPQTHSNIEFSIYYTIERFDPSGGCLDHIVTYKKIPVSADWQPGKIYTYEIEFAFSEIEDNRINLGLTVKDWDKVDVSTEIN